MKLKSRYGDEYELEELGNEKLKFELPGHTRVGFGEDNKELEFIDPPGGPFIMKGDFLGDRKIKEFEDFGSYIIINLEEA